MEADLPPERPKEEIPTSELMTRFRKVKDEQPEFRPHFKTNPNFDVMVVSSLDGLESYTRWLNQDKLATLEKATANGKPGTRR